MKGLGCILVVPLLIGLLFIGFMGGLFMAGGIMTKGFLEVEAPMWYEAGMETALSEGVQKYATDYNIPINRTIFLDGEYYHEYPEEDDPECSGNRVKVMTFYVRDPHTRTKVYFLGRFEESFGLQELVCMGTNVVLRGVATGITTFGVKYTEPDSTNEMTAVVHTRIAGRDYPEPRDGDEVEPSGNAFEVEVNKDFDSRNDA